MGPGDASPGTDSPNRFGLWSLTPFANRAFGAHILDGDMRIALPVNDPSTGSCIHGFGWQCVWREAGRDEAMLRLEHRRTGTDDPYSYLATQTVLLAPDHVQIGLSVVNDANRPLPFGLGLHPWFPAAADTRLTLRAQGALALGPGYRAIGLDPWQRGGPFAEGERVVSQVELAHSIIDWEGEAILATPSRGIRLAIDASANLRHPVLWSPADADFVCLEPQSHGIGAPSEDTVQTVTPLRRLAPGETMTGWMTLRPARL